MIENNTVEHENSFLNIFLTFNILLAILSSILVGSHLDANNLLATMGYMLLLPIAFITHIVAFITYFYQIIKKKNSHLSLFISIITAIIIFYPAIDDFKM